MAVGKLLLHVVGEDLLRAFYKLLRLRFCVSSEKTLCNKDFYKEFERDFYIKIIDGIIPANLIRNSLLSLFCPFLETKNKNKVFSKLVVW